MSRKPGSVMRAAVLVALWAAVLAAGGCSSRVRGMPDLAAVSGRIVLDGRPLAKVAVIFSSEKGHSSLGITDEQGHYSLKFIGNHRGAEIGRHLVALDGLGGLDHPPGPNFKNPVPAEFGVKSTLTADVKPGTNTINFDLTTPQ